MVSEQATLLGKFDHNLLEIRNFVTRPSLPTVITAIVIFHNYELKSHSFL